MEPYLWIKDLKVNFKSYEGEKNVLSIDELKINKGEAYGIIGESGTGKTVMALTILKLLEMPPGKIESGEIYLDGEDILKLSDKEMQRRIRGKKIAMIFQDPMSTLNPVFTVGKQMIEVIEKNQGLKKEKAHKKAIEMIELVKLPDGESIMKKYPHELSGGQRQRVIIALALSCGADLIIADEPTRNLDVTIQAGILKLIKELQTTLGVSVLFIANNPGIIYATCDYAGILYNGEIVERGKTRTVLKFPAHPYTKTLVDLNIKNSDSKDEINNLDDSACCPYYRNCSSRIDKCLKSPDFIKLKDGHEVKCHLWDRGDKHE